MERPRLCSSTLKDEPMRGMAIVALALLLWPGLGRAQMHQHHSAAPDSTAHHHEMHAGMDMSGMDMGAMSMTGFYGPYAMSREASGTSWQPEAAEHTGVHIMSGPWM